MTHGVIDGKLKEFRDLFLKWNDKINLSAAASASDVDAHIRDSSSVVAHLCEARTVIDVGAGGGFPVVVAAISLPDVLFTALEPVRKKHAFLRTAARELGLTNLDARAQRVEDHDARDYDVAMSRATFDLREWILLGLTLVRPGGFVIGFEATQRDDLPTPFTRHAYDLAGKTRSLILATRTTE